MSKRWLRVANSGYAPSTYPTPDSPGPPGLTSREPMRSAGSLAGTTMTEVAMVPREGRA